MASSSRNCSDWKPLAESRRVRKLANWPGVIVSSTSIWATTVLRIVRTRRTVASARGPSPASSRCCRWTSSWMSCLNQSSYTWWMTMNSSSSCSSVFGRWAARISSSARYEVYVRAADSSAIAGDTRTTAVLAPRARLHEDRGGPVEHERSGNGGEDAPPPGGLPPPRRGLYRRRHRRHRRRLLRRRGVHHARRGPPWQGRRAPGVREAARRPAERRVGRPDADLRGRRAVHRVEREVREDARRGRHRHVRVPRRPDPRADGPLHPAAQLGARRPFRPAQLAGDLRQAGARLHAAAHRGDYRPLAQRRLVRG